MNNYLMANRLTKNIIEQIKVVLINVFITLRLF